PPDEMFGKLMSIPDTLMGRYYDLLLCEPVPDIHPMEAKKQLAARIIERYHGADAAKAAREEFEIRFSKKDLASADLPELNLAGLQTDIVSVVVAAYGRCFSIT